MEGYSKNGNVLQMQSFSVHDGEGIRTTIFLCGCPLRCKWCANPDSWSITESSQRKLCVEEVIKKVKRDEIFYRFSNGGVTFSGGEPTVQKEFLRELSQKISEIGIDMWIETCGEFIWEEVEDIFGYFSHAFMDIKCMDNNLHKAMTGKGNTLILENIKKVYNSGLPITIRIPLIKEVNLSEENLVATAEYIRNYIPNADLELLPYHNLGREKYIACGLDKYIFDFTTPSKEEILWAEKLIENIGVKIISYT